MEFIQLGEPLVETNKKFFRFFFFSLTFHYSLNCAKKRQSVQLIERHLVTVKSSAQQQLQLEIMLNSASYLKLLSPFLHHLSSASHSFI